MAKTILIAEQSEIIRKGLIKVIGSFDIFDNINELTVNANIEASVVRHEPDILIINPAMITVPMQRWIKEQKNGKMKVAAIIYSLFDDALNDLFDEVIQISDTRIKIRNKLNSLVNRMSETKQHLPDDTLSNREKDIVKLLAKGMSNKEISDQLFISPHTVTTHRKNITRKLNIKSVAGLIVYAIINDIVSVEELS